MDFQWKGVPASPSVPPFGTGRVVRPLQKSRGELGACQTGAESRICRAFQWGYMFHPSRNVGPLAAGFRVPGLPFPAGVGSSGWQRPVGARLDDFEALGHFTVRIPGGEVHLRETAGLVATCSLFPRSRDRFSR